MPTMDRKELAGWVGKDAVDDSGSKIGKIADIYLDDATGEPEWLAVNTGMFGTSVSFVPMTSASASGDDVKVPFSKSQVTGAPKAEADGALSQEEEAQLYSHYGIEYTESRSDSGLPGVRTGGTGTDIDTTRTGGADAAMTRSEEEIKVEKRSREAGTVRLRKWVETEHVTKTVPVQREEVRIEREAISDANRDKALDGPEITEAVHEVTLREEEAVATTEVVPQERIRLDTETVTEDQKVEADVRKERVEVEGDGTQVRDETTTRTDRDR